MSLRRAHPSSNESFLSLFAQFKSFYKLPNVIGSFYIVLCNIDVIVNENFCCPILLAFLKIGVESHDGVPFLIGPKLSKNFICPQKDKNQYFFSKFFLDGLKFDHSLFIHFNSFLYLTSFFPHDSYACLLSTSNSF